MATKPVEIEILLKDRLSAGLDTMQRKLDAMMAESTSAVERVRLLEAAIRALNMQLMALKEAGEEANPDLDQRENLAAIEQVETKIKELQVQLKTLDETAKGTQTVPPGTTQAVKQYNGLHMSIQQIAREMPSLAMGPQMFFLAISNNLPIFTDELARARKEYEALTASGQKATPVWKQVLSSLFSWQTALTTGIMLLVMYGDEIVDWVTGLFKAQKAIDATAAEQRNLNAAMGEARTSAARETTQLTLLYKMTQNTSASLHDRKVAVSELQSQYPAYFGNLSQEAILAGEAAGQYRQLANDILQAAYARAYQKRIESLAEQNVGLKRAINADTNWTRRNRDEYNRRLERIRLSTESAQAFAGSSTDAAAAAATGVLERQTDEIITEYERRTEALAKNKEQLEANEQAMKSYEQEVLKRQKPLLQTTQGKNYAPGKAGKGSGTGKEGDGRKLAEQKLNDELLAMERQNRQEELGLMEEGTEKKLAQIDADYDKRKAEIEKKARELAEINRKAEVTDVNASGLTKSQQDEVDRAIRLNDDTRRKETAKVYEAEAAALRDYLKDYGTFQEQKLAIAEEYAEKISHAQTEGERLRLKAERDSSLQQVEINAVRQQIDWGNVFSDFGTMFKDQLQPTIDKLRKIADSDAFKQSSLEEQSALYELISKLENANATWDSDIFKHVSDDINSYQEAMLRYANAVERARIAEDNLTKAKSTLDNAKKKGLDENTINAAQANVDTARAEFNAASEDVKNFGSQVQETTTSLNSSAAQAKAMFESLSSGLKGLFSGSLEGIGNGVLELDKLFGGELTKNAGNSLAKGFQSLLGKDSQAAKTLSEALGNSGLAGQIISAILGVLDMLAEGGVGGLVSNLEDTVFGAVNGILDDIFSGGIITKPIQSAIDGISGIVDTITFGALGSWLGGNDKEVMETVNRLTESNEYLRESIDGLAERIGDSSKTNTESIDYYNEARKAELEWEENQRNIIKSLASAWTNSGYGFLGLGGKGSFNKHSPGSDWEGWAAFTDTLQRNGINITIDSTGDLWNLTPEQMALLRDNNPKEWQKLFSGDGHKNPMDAVNEYIERAGTLDDLTNALNEKLTGYSWTDFLSQYKEMIKDAESTTEDFADFIRGTIGDALVESFVNEQLQGDIKELYDYIADAAADGISSDEMSVIEEMNAAIAEKAQSWRDTMVAAGMIDSEKAGTTQSGKAGTYTALSQEQGTKLEGLWTTSAMHLSSIDDQMQDVSQQMGSAVDSLRRIEENTGLSAKYLSEIKEEIKKIVRDGLKMK